MSRFSSLTLIALTFVLAPVLGGCDRQSSPPAQPTAEASGTDTSPIADATTPTPETIASPTASPAAGPVLSPGNTGGETLSGTVDRTHKGSRPPSITLKDGAGQQLALEKVHGPMLVNLWATWCAPCVAELPTLDRLASDNAGKLTVITVSQDVADNDGRVPDFLSAKGGSHLKPWLDPDNALLDHYATGVLPTTVLYGKDGREIWRVVGGLDWSSPEGRKLIAEATG